MKNLAISLLVVGAVFGNLTYSADGQIEQLKIELQERVKILDHEKHLFALSTELVSETDKVSPITRHGILYWQSEARESVKRTEVSIESIERKILNLVDLKSKEGGVFGSTVHCMRDNVLNMQSEARKIAKTVKPANTDKPPIVKSKTFERKIEKLTDLKSEEDGVFGSAVCSVDNQIERLKIVRQERVNILDREKWAFDEITKLVSEEEYSFFTRYRILYLKIVAQGEVGNLDREKEAFLEITKLASKEETSDYTRDELLCWQSEASGRIKRAEVSIESIERKIVKLNDLNLLVVGAFGSTVHSADHQIERLGVALGKRVTIMDMSKNSKDKLDASVKKMKKQYGDFADIMSGLPINEFLEESLITEKEVADNIDSLKRKIKKLTDLKADGYIK